MMYSRAGIFSARGYGAGQSVRSCSPLPLRTAVSFQKRMKQTAIAVARQCHSYDDLSESRPSLNVLSQRRRADDIEFEPTPAGP